MKYVAAIEVNRHHESKDDQLDRLTRQLREEKARNAKAFDSGAAMVINAIRMGVPIEEIATKVRWDLLQEPYVARTKTEEWDDTARIAIPLEFADSEEITEVGVEIPLEK